MYFLFFSTTRHCRDVESPLNKLVVHYLMNYLAQVLHGSSTLLKLVSACKYIIVQVSNFVVWEKIKGNFQISYLETNVQFRHMHIAPNLRYIYIMHQLTFRTFVSRPSSVRLGAVCGCICIPSDITRRGGCVTAFR